MYYTFRKREFTAVRHVFFNGSWIKSCAVFDHFGAAVDWVAKDKGAPRTIARPNGRHLVRAGDSQTNLGYVRETTGIR